MSNYFLKQNTFTPPAQQNRPYAPFNPQQVFQTYTPTDNNFRQPISQQNSNSNRIQQVPNYKTFEGVSQSAIFPNRHSPVEFSNHCSILDRMAKKVSTQFEQTDNQIKTIASIRNNHDMHRSNLDEQYFRNQNLPHNQHLPQNQSLQQNQGNSGQMKSNQAMQQIRPPTPIKLKENQQQGQGLQQSQSYRKRSEEIPYDNQHINIIQNMESLRGSLTNRDVQPVHTHQSLHQSISPIQKKIWNIPKYQYQTAKIHQQSLESTHSSSGGGHPQVFHQFKQQIPVTQTDYLNNIKKTLSPANLWPLAVSPSQEKMQSQNEKIGFDFINQKLKEKNSQPQSQFKKKKPTDFILERHQNDVPPKKVAQQKIFTIDNFQIVDKIGKGAFGDVFIARQKITGFVCVLKKILKRKIKEQKLQEHLIREIKIQSYLCHKHLTTLYGFFADQETIYLIIELMPDGSFFQVKKRKKICESECSNYLRQLCQGLKYMHQQNIIHRDVKPENLLMNEGYVKIGDFGCSVFANSMRNTIVGSLAYKSPEQLNQDYYDDKIDVWSVGIFAYEMLIGKSPFQEDIIKIARQEIQPKLSKLTFPTQCQISLEAQDFIEKLLHQDPNQRMDINNALKHEFLKKHIDQYELHGKYVEDHKQL